MIQVNMESFIDLTFSDTGRCSSPSQIPGTEQAVKLRIMRISTRQKTSACRAGDWNFKVEEVNHKLCHQMRFNMLKMKRK